MHGLISYTLRALELPPAETVRRARAGCYALGGVATARAFDHGPSPAR